MAEKLYWRIYRQRFSEASDYEDVVIEMLPSLIRRRRNDITVYEDDSRVHNKVEYRWQTDRYNPSEAYAFRIEIEAESLDYLRDANAIMRRVLRDLRNPSPGEVVKRLESLRPPAQMMIYDGRLSGFLQPARILPPEVHRFVDDWSQVPGHTGRGCTVDALAHVEDGAVDKIERNLREYVENNAWSNRNGYLEAWLAAGRPVRDTTMYGYGWKAPTVKSASAVIAGK